MHELSICHSIAQIVENAAEGRSVQTVRLDVGQLRQVVPDTLVYSWDIVVDGTPLEGATLDVNYIKGSFDCGACGRTTEIDIPVFRCQCGSTDVEVTSGRELLVTSLDLATPEPTGG
jgi:hydrogenase nickel incorporation protein HypA/HybF